MLNVTDIDHEPEMIEQARKNLIPSIESGRHRERMPPRALCRSAIAKRPLPTDHESPVVLQLRAVEVRIDRHAEFGRQTVTASEPALTDQGDAE